MWIVCLSVTVVVFPCCLNETLCLHSAPGGEEEERGRSSEEEPGAAGEDWPGSSLSFDHECSTEN